MKCKCLFVFLVMLSLSNPFLLKAQQNTGQPVLIYGELHHITGLDTIEISFWKNYIYEQGSYKGFEKIKISTQNGNVFNGGWGGKTFIAQLPVIDKPTYISLFLSKNKYNGLEPTLDRYIIEPGDSVRIKVDMIQGKLLFGGPSVDKFRCQYEIRLAQAERQFNSKHVMFTPNADTLKMEPAYIQARMNLRNQGKLVRFIKNSEDYMSWITDNLKINENELADLKIIERYRGKVSDDFLMLMQADVIGKHRSDILIHFNRGFKKREPHVMKVYHELMERMSEVEIPVYIATQSAHYSEYLFWKEIIYTRAEKLDIVKHFTENYDGELRDKLIAKLLIQYYPEFESGNEMLTNAMGVVKTPWVDELLSDLYNSKAKGRPAFDFALPDKDNKLVRLSDFKGKTVLIDFWFTGCGACIIFHKNYILPTKAYFKKNPNFEVITISSDAARKKWLESLAKNEYTTPDAINLYTGGAGFKHEMLKHYNIHAYPYQLLIDKNGKIFQAGGLRPKEPEDLIKMIESAMGN